jgi:hypothetical protein
MTGDRETIADLKRRADIAEIVGRHVALKPRGRHEHWGCCPFHLEGTPSFKADTRTGRYHCFGCGAKGDVLDFVAAIEGLDTGGAILRLRELAGSSPPAPRRLVAISGDKSERNRGLARDLWAEAETIRPGGLPWLYLTETRRISAWDPERLRYHGACPWGGDRVPAIVVPVQDHATGEVVAVWRIRPVLEGKVERKGLGPSGGNCARLCPADGPELAIAEGVEDALAYAELEGVPCWAALSAGNMGGLVLPERFREVVVVADADPVGRANAAKLVRRLRAEGRDARRIVAVGHKDANDVLRARGTPA